MSLSLGLLLAGAGAWFAIHDLSTRRGELFGTLLLIAGLAGAVAGVAVLTLSSSDRVTWSRSWLLGIAASVSTVIACFAIAALTPPI